jgi:hypothetical protein
MTAGDLELFSRCCHFSNDPKHAATLAAEATPLLSRARRFVDRGIHPDSAAAIAVKRQYGLAD